jgi:hypothetical protein
MSDQLPLLDWTPAHQKHSETSKAAAIAIKPHVGPMHIAILKYLERWGATGATDQEMQDYLDLEGSTQRPRRRELQLWGYIVKSGTTRKTESGRAAVVWVLARPE